MIVSHKIHYLLLQIGFKVNQNNTEYTYSRTGYKLLLQYSYYYNKLVLSIYYNYELEFNIHDDYYDNEEELYNYLLERFNKKIRKIKINEL